MNTTDARRILETALICAQQPLSVRELQTLFGGALGADAIRALLDDLRDEWCQRGVELVCVASGWRFQSRPEMREYLDRLHPEKPPRYSRATLETLAIIAYRQPVTRGDMEDIRGVTINTQILKQLEDRGWVNAIGHRETVGRPALYATTRQFLDDLGIAALDQLPLLEEPGAETPSMFEALAQSLGGDAGGADDAAPISAPEEVPPESMTATLAEAGQAEFVEDDVAAVAQVSVQAPAPIMQEPPAEAAAETGAETETGLAQSAPPFIPDALAEVADAADAMAQAFLPDAAPQAAVSPAAATGIPAETAAGTEPSKSGMFPVPPEAAQPGDAHEI